MSALISKQAAIDAIDEIESEVADGEGFQYEKWRQYFENLPTAQPERKKGKWIYQPGLGWGETWICSECGEKTTSTALGKPKDLWCPMCGAEMKGDENEVDG